VTFGELKKRGVWAKQAAQIKTVAVTKTEECKVKQQIMQHCKSNTT
jgi:hypothetical protein